MNKNIKLNYIYNVVYQMLLVLTPVITIPYLSRTLGASGIGQVSYAESIVTYFVLFASLGICTYGQREVSYSQDDKIRRTEVFYNTLFAKLISSIILSIIYLIIFFFYFKSTIYMILFISLISVAFDINWFFQGIEEFKKIIVRSSLLKLIYIIFIFKCVNTYNGIYAYTFGMVLLTLLCNLSLWPSIHNYIGSFRINKLNIIKVFSESLTLFLPTVAIQIYTVFDKTMIGLITKDMMENGYYEQSIKISRSLLMIVTALSTVVIPRVGYYFSRNEHELVKSILYKSYRFVLMISVPICLGIFCITDNFVPWFLGSGFDKSVLLVKIFSLLIIFISLSNITGILYFVPTKQQMKLTVSVCIGAIINFLLNLVLISTYESVGAAIASVFAEGAITLIQFYLARDYISLKVIIKQSYKYFLSGTLMLIVVSIFACNVESSIINSFLLSSIGAIFYFTILIIFKDEFLIYYIPHNKN